MLTKTFCHVDGVSQKTEELLWNLGISSWEDFLERMDELEMISELTRRKIHSQLIFSQEALQKKDFGYFKRVLPEKEHWRLVGHAKIAFVDIETTGLSRWSDELTMIGIYDDEGVFTYIKGQNLEEAKEKLKDYDILVSFNGKQFDLPFIEYKFKEKYDCVHLDLRFLLKQFGYKGGLKVIERELGIQRGDEVKDVNGFEAVRLWKKYERGCRESLALLIQYNREDIVNLKTLLDYYIERKENELRRENKTSLQQLS
jgi:hypothetical protein